MRPKIARFRLGMSFLGAPMTMISDARRSASWTIAAPAVRARMSRGITLTPYDSPIARASSSSRFASSSSAGMSADSGRSSGISIT